MVEERLRRELERIATPGDPSGVAERVLGRVTRRRTIRRVQTAGLTLAVIAGTIAGTYGLSRVFVPAGVRQVARGSVAPSPSGVSSPSALPTTLAVAGTSLPVCDVSSVQGDFLADGIPDQAYVFVPASDPATCPEPGRELTLVGLQPDSSGSVTTTFGPIECPDGCRAFAAADVDGDGRAELAVVTGRSGSTEALSFFRVVDRDGAPAIEQVQIANPEGSSASALTTSIGSSGGCTGEGSAQAPGTVGSLSARAGSLSLRYRSWYGSGDHASGVRAGQDPTTLDELARAAEGQGLGWRAIRGIYDPSFSWGLNDPNGGDRLLRFLLHKPDLLRAVLDFNRGFRPDTTEPYYALNPGGQSQAALLEEFPELHAAYTVMAEGRRPLSRFWTNEGNLIPLASIAGDPDTLGRRAAAVLRAFQEGLRQFPDRNYFFKGGVYAGPKSFISLRPDLAAFVRAWQPAPPTQDQGACGPSI